MTSSSRRGEGASVSRICICQGPPNDILSYPTLPTSELLRVLFFIDDNKRGEENSQQFLSLIASAFSLFFYFFYSWTFVSCAKLQKLCLSFSLSFFDMKMRR